MEIFNKKWLSNIRSICENSNIGKIMSLKYVPEGVFCIEKWNKLIEKIAEKHGKAPVIIIDYLRKLKTNKKIFDERLRVDDIIGKLTNIAKEYNIPILAISELARDSYKSGQRLSMASFKESGNIEYEASWLGILAAVEEENGEYKLKANWESIVEYSGDVDLIVFKAKRGTGTTGKVPFKVDRDKMTVIDRSGNNSINKNKLSRIK
jgi:replicative DNA helicase